MSLKNRVFTFFLGIAGLFVISIDMQAVVVPAILTLLTLALFMEFRVKINGVTAAASLFLTIGIVGYLSSNSKNSTLGTSFGLLIPKEQRAPTANLFSAAALSLILGATIIGVRELQVVDTPQLSKFLKNDKMVLWAFIPMVGIAIGFDFIKILNRGEHLVPVRFSLLARLAFSLCELAIPVLALWGRFSNRPSRLISFMGLLLYGLIFFSFSSRALIFVPVGFLILFWSQISRIRNLCLTLLATIATAYAYLVPLYLRSLPTHGLIPYLRNIGQIKFTSVDVMSAVQNLLVSFDLNGLSAFYLTKFPKKDLLIELSPLPGGWAGWYGISDAHRFNSATPAAGIGEAMNYGYLYLIFIFLLVGMVITKLDKMVNEVKSQNAIYFRYLLVAGTSYFAILCFQYNLRSAIRIVYYMVALVAIYYFYEKKKLRSYHA